MFANYHTHTPLCHHASGEEREYIENAIKGGMKILGFSDHSPQFFSTDYVSWFRMTSDESYGYVERLRALAKEYRDDIKILIGFEAEYYPDIFDKLTERCRELDIDYLLMGQHFVIHEENGGIYSGTASDSDERLTQYVDNVTEGLSTGYFTYLAHPDLLNYTGTPEFYEAEMTRLCKKAKELSIPVEINMLGYQTARNYPCDRFFRIAKEVGCDVIIGCDAHSPDVLSNTDLHKQTYDYAASFGIEPITEVKLRKPF